MKKLIVIVIVLGCIVGVANRDVELTSLENLQALERCGDSLEGTRDALTWINEHALEHLPVAATLRVEDAIAGVALELSEPEQLACL